MAGDESWAVAKKNRGKAIGRHVSKKTSEQRFFSLVSK